MEPVIEINGGRLREKAQRGSMASLFDTRSPDPLAFFPQDYFMETPGFLTSKAGSDEAA